MEASLSMEPHGVRRVDIRTPSFAKPHRTLVHYPQFVRYSTEVAMISVIALSHTTGPGW